MNIESHFNLIIDKYKLKYLFIKFIRLSILTTTIKECFYWLLIYFSEIIKNKPELINKFSIILIGIIGINIPTEKYFNYIKTKLMIEIKIANTKYFNDRLIRMSKHELLNFDLVEYYNILDNFNENLQNYIMNIKVKQDIPIRIITLIIIALNKNFNILIGLFAVFYAIVKSLSKNKIHKETKLTKELFFYENTIRNYIINSKNFLINDEFNKEYLTGNFNKLKKVNNHIDKLNNNLDMNINLAMFGFIIIVIYLRIDKLNQYDFFYYFLIIYDIEFISDKIIEYYKSEANYNKMTERLNYLNSFIPVNSNNYINKKVNKIIIKNIFNDNPKIQISEPFIIEQNEHILITGDSGSGKTSFLYLLKGIIKPKILEIEPNINIINSQSYITLNNHKSLYSGNLYDIISNYDKNPNINLIIQSLQFAKIFDILNKNIFIDIEKLSGGERIRILIARIIYIVKTKNYNILLFDEIDENINDQLAIEICLNIRNIFKDKIILYISHNNKVKLLFNKKYIVNKGLITIN